MTRPTIPCLTPSASRAKIEGSRKDRLPKSVDHDRRAVDFQSSADWVAVMSSAPEGHEFAASPAVPPDMFDVSPLFDLFVGICFQFENINPQAKVMRKFDELLTGFEGAGCLGRPPFLGRDDLEDEAHVQERSILQHPLQKFQFLAQRRVVRLQGLDLANRV